MTLLAPWAVWLLPVLGAVTALYFLKLRRIRATVPSLDIWRILGAHTRTRSLFHRFKRWLSLLLWLIIALCLILAAGNPIIALGAVKPQAFVIILDNSASMQTQDDPGSSRSRLDLARQAVGTLTSRRPVPDEWLLIEAGAEARVAQSWTRDGALVRAAARDLAPRLGPGSLEEAVALARGVLAGRPQQTIVLITDGNDGEAARLAEHDDIVLWPVGTSRDNLGITSLRVRAHRQEGAQYVFVAVANVSDDTLETTLTFTVDQAPVAVESVQIEPRGRWEKNLKLSYPAGGVLHASLDRDDRFPQDNDAFAVLPPLHPARVLIVSAPGESFFLESALAAMVPLVDLAGSSTIDLPTFERTRLSAAPTPPSPPTSPPPDLTIFNNIRPPAALPPGAYVFINGWPANLGVRPLGVIEHPSMDVVDRRHPLTQFLALRGANVARAAELDLPASAVVLVASPESQPLVFLLSEPGRTYLSLAFDVLETDLPFRNALPVLLHNAIAHLVTERPPLIHDQYHPGDPIVPLRDLPPDITQASLAALTRGGEQALLDIPVTQGRFVASWPEVAPVRLTLGDQTAYCAVNIASEQETRIAPLTAPLPSDQLGLGRSLLGSLPWMAFALGGLLLVAAEWLTYHRRWTE